jgi:spore coat protein U-like protein
MTSRSILALLIAGSTLAAAALARADSIGARMDVSATVIANCSLMVQPLSFGIYDPLVTNSAQPADASAVVTVSCTRNSNASVTLDFGLHSLSGVDRLMSGPGTENLHYQIYRDAARSQIWSRGGDSVQLLSRGISQPEQLTVFGRIPPRQEVEPGAYSDVLTAAVNF